MLNLQQGEETSTPGEGDIRPQDIAKTSQHQGGEQAPRDSYADGDAPAEPQADSEVNQIEQDIACEQDHGPGQIKDYAVPVLPQHSGKAQAEQDENQQDSPQAEAQQEQQLACIGGALAAGKASIPWNSPAAASCSAAIAHSSPMRVGNAQATACMNAITLTPSLAEEME